MRDPFEFREAKRLAKEIIDREVRDAVQLNKQKQRDLREHQRESKIKQ